MADKSPFKGGNLKVVLLSVVAATTFWFFTALNKNYSARINYPLEFQFAKDSVVIMQDLAEDVLIDVSSGGWNLLRKTFWFNVQPILITLDNPTEVKFLTRSSLMPLVSDQINDLELNFLLTDTLYVDVEEKISRTILVDVDSMRLPLAPNYRLTSPIMMGTDTIQVTGPASMVNALPNTILLEVPRRNIDDDYDRDVEIDLPNTRLMSSDPEEVQINFDVAEFKNVTLPVRLDLLNFPEDSSAFLRDSLIYVNYWINADELSTVTPEDFSITADFTLMNKEDSTIIPILIASPENAYDTEYLPDTLSINYRVAIDEQEAI